jgi:hypothetical protein
MLNKYNSVQFLMSSIIIDGNTKVFIFDSKNSLGFYKNDIN